MIILQKEVKCCLQPAHSFPLKGWFWLTLLCERSGNNKFPEHNKRTFAVGPHSTNSFGAASSRVWPCLAGETVGGGRRVSSPLLPWLSLGLVGEQETGRRHGSSSSIWFALDLWVCLYIVPLYNLVIILLWVLPSYCLDLFSLSECVWAWAHMRATAVCGSWLSPSNKWVPAIKLC